MKGLETTEEEHRQLKLMYRSEGFGIMVRLMDATIGIKFGEMMQSGIKDTDVIRVKNEILGVKEAKEIVFNIIKEGEGQYENKTT